jgi:hypothetical protein
MKCIKGNDDVLCLPVPVCLRDELVVSLNVHIMCISLLFFCLHLLCFVECGIRRL